MQKCALCNKQILFNNYELHAEKCSVLNLNPQNNSQEIEQNDNKIDDSFNMGNLRDSIQNQNNNQNIITNAQNGQNREEEQKIDQNQEIECEFCEMKIKIGEKEEHKYECQQQCIYCWDIYPYFLLQDHYNHCDHKIKLEQTNIFFNNGDEFSLKSGCLILYHPDQKFWKIQIQGYKTILTCGKLTNELEEKSDGQKIERVHSKLDQISEYVSSKVNNKLDKKYTIQQYKKKNNDMVNEDDQDDEIDISHNNENIKQDQEQIDNCKIVNDHEIEILSSEWALLVAMHSLKEEGKDYATREQIIEQIQTLSFSFDIKLKRQYVFQTMRTDKKLIRELNEGDETYYSLSDTGIPLAKMFYQNQIQTEKSKENIIKHQPQKPKQSERKIVQINRNANNNNFQINVKSPSILIGGGDSKSNINSRNGNNNLLVPDFIYDENSQMSLKALTDISVNSSRANSRDNSLDFEDQDDNRSIASYRSNASTSSQKNNYIKNDRLGKSSSKAFSVLLAEKWEDTKYDPQNYYMSEKLDGVRGVWTGTQLFSRNKNRFFPPKFFTENWPNCMLDGELWTKRYDFSKCLSYVRKKVPIDDLYDCPGLNKSFSERYKTLAEEIQKLNNPYIICHPHIKCRNQKHLDDNLEEVLKHEGEGVMMRLSTSYYENRRTTSLLKVKVFHDAEATVIGHVKGNGRNAYVTGSLLCRNDDGIEFKVGSGLDDKLRRNPPKIGPVITYKYQEVSSKDKKPRFPIFLRVHHTV